MLSRIGGGGHQQQPSSAPPSPPAITMAAGNHHHRVPHEVDDLDEYLSEYKLQAPIEPIAHYADGELEAEWLNSAGFPQLTKAFEEGRELSATELAPVISGLSSMHAEAVKQRVKALNRTVRGRTRNRSTKKPDIRDVFRDQDSSSTGTRSRSATPDSLDSLPGDDAWNTPTSNGHHHHHHPHIPSFVSVFDGNGVVRPTPIRGKQHLRRTPSAPLRGSAELFRGSHIRCDIPINNEGIELLNFQRLGTIHIPRIRSGSDPSCTIGPHAGQHISGTRSHTNLYNGTAVVRRDNDDSGNSSSEQSPPSSPPRNSLLSSVENSPLRSSYEPVSFESMIKQTTPSAADQWQQRPETAREPCLDIDQISEGEQKRLQPLLWLELASLFDKNHVSLDKRKPFKRKRKEEGNVFGVSLNALVRRDQQVTGEDTTLVPLVLQAILAELAVRGAREEGILRVPGHKQKTEALYNEIEHNFYSKPEKIDPLIKKAGVHDLSALLKRWLRELPQPLLANDLVHLFYQTNVLPPHDQYKALAVLCQLLPHENRNTLRELLNFFRRVVELQDLNKMSQQNVATIIAPSFFPPRFVHPPDKNDIGAQVRMAAQCCHLTNVLITMTDSLWLVPQRLIEQGKMINKNGQPKRQLTRKAKNGSGSIISINRSATNGGDFVFDTNHIHRLVI
ncbi:rho GTPase-activating protein conundrum [Anopheles stephensi]|uniref:rho GTPase-activating protein conundrum n=1 Tax=Anopheles stephensi TaxID=30069 RepID=UPI0016587A5D|nr:rho GTPase-activating protein conundrum [Anopheles stephensi]XP_035915420.1 rho GTPase-activating protein conundrum [Anopheles stephensi]XP_035915421.1 rho GTPase-activating protein conundrum [Anopheles stephensi]XP_035915422.1 rho GTPase-activating protein conundrum [Anopheles stephensi]XP_035915423.1 rho GTPase-activating protein conundrum [Anopheles stephensi]XP_035915425.1 rho GTPase-activating protein conundrum [Anopheles stephensi]XP_035915426.1 rho GTPase-activating protein conundru